MKILVLFFIFLLVIQYSLQLTVQHKNMLKNKIRMHMKSQSKNKSKHKIKSKHKSKIKNHLKSLEQEENQAWSQNRLRISDDSWDRNQIKMVQTDNYDEYGNLYESEAQILHDIQFRSDKYKPINYYQLNHSDPQYSLLFREQIYHNNSHFFDMPKSMVEERNKLAEKYGFPTDEEVQRVKEGKDPFIMKKFNTKFEQDFYKKYYMEACYHDKSKSHQEELELIKRDAMNYLLQNEGEKEIMPYPRAKPSDKIPFGDTRFQEKPSPCTQPVINKFWMVDLQRCWASSRLDRLWRYDWWNNEENGDIIRKHNQGRDFAGYPCKEWIQKETWMGVWISNPRNVDKKQNPWTIFRWDFLHIQIIKKMKINWVSEPQEWEIQETQNMLVWEPGPKMEDKGKKWDGMEGFILFIDPIWARGMRLVMESNEEYIGIRGIECYRIQLTVMIENRWVEGWCFTRQEGDYFTNGAGTMEMNCIDAVSMGDAREVWVIDLFYDIKSYGDKYCLTVMNNPNDEKLPRLNVCDGTAMQKFSVERTGKIESKYHRDTCLTMDRHGLNDNIAYLKPTSASSTFPGHPTFNAVDQSETGYWLSSAGEQEWFQVDFGKVQTVGKVEISWEYPPQEWDLIIGGVPFMSMTATQMNFFAEFAPMSATNVKIVMKKFDPTKSMLPSEKWGYGLKRLNVFRGGNKMFFTACSVGGPMRAHRFKLVTVEYTATCASSPVKKLSESMNAGGDEVAAGADALGEIEKENEKLDKADDELEEKVEEVLKDLDDLKKKVKEKKHDPMKNQEKKEKKDKKKKDDDKKNDKDKKDEKDEKKKEKCKRFFRFQQKSNGQYAKEYYDPEKERKYDKKLDYMMRFQENQFIEGVNFIYEDSEPQNTSQTNEADKNEYSDEVGQPRFLEQQQGDISQRAYIYIQDMWGLELDENEDDYGLSFYGVKLKDVDGSPPNPDPNTLGTIVTNPARSCLQIKDMFPCQRSGYYYILPHCSEEPIRMFCDFTSGNALLYMGQTPDNEPDYMRHLKNIDGIRYICSLKGLYPLEFQNEKQIEVAMNMIRHLNVQTDTGAVAFGYDYECIDDQSKCNRKYQSLNSKSSQFMTTQFKKYLDLTNYENRPTKKDGYKAKKNAIGMNVDDNKLGYIDLQDDKIYGVICSDNSNSLYNQITRDENSFLLNCGTTLFKESSLNPSKNKFQRVKCPANCADEEQFKVYGKNPFAVINYLKDKGIIINLSCCNYGRCYYR